MAIWQYKRKKFYIFSVEENWGNPPISCSASQNACRFQFLNSFHCRKLKRNSAICVQAIHLQEQCKRGGSEIPRKIINQRPSVCLNSTEKRDWSQSFAISRILRYLFVSSAVFWLFCKTYWHHLHSDYANHLLLKIAIYAYMHVVCLAHFRQFAWNIKTPIFGIHGIPRKTRISHFSCESFI